MTDLFAVQMLFSSGISLSENQVYEKLKIKYPDCMLNQTFKLVNVSYVKYLLTRLVESEYLILKDGFYSVNYNRNSLI